MLAGVKNDPFYFGHIQGLIERLNLRGRVLLLGYIPQEDLVSLYNMALAVVSVSFCEGFGLPTLEAMACAKAVIASGNTSMAEIVGDCGILVDPYNIEEITAAMDKVLGDESLEIAWRKRGFSAPRSLAGKRRPGR